MGNFTILEDIKTFDDEVKKCREELPNLHNLGEDNDFPELATSFTSHLRSSLPLLENLMSRLSIKMVIWKHAQQRQAAGLHFHSDTTIGTLQHLLKELFHPLWDFYKLIDDAIRTDYPNLIQLKKYLEKVKYFLRKLLQMSFIVEKQPPKFIQTKTFFTNTIKLSFLLGIEENILSSDLFSTVKTSIIKGEQASMLLIQDQGGEVKSIGEIEGGDGTMSYSEKNENLALSEHYSVILGETKGRRKISATKLLGLKDDRRPGGGDKEDLLAMQRKYCLCFTCNVTIGSLNFDILTTSLPFAVTTYSGQGVKALGPIMYDYAVSEMFRQPFHAQREASWSTIKEVFNKLWIQGLSSEEFPAGQPLTVVNWDCLVHKAFRLNNGEKINHDEINTETISWDLLFKEKLPDRNFTFWEWFYSALKLFEDNPHLKQLWNQGLIMGVIGKEESVKLLSGPGAKFGTFLVRFTDSVTGHITADYFISTESNPNGEIQAKNPYQLTPVNQNTNLADLLRKEPDLTHLYALPNCRAKDEAFSKFYEKENNPNLQPEPNQDDYTVSERGGAPRKNSYPSFTQTINTSRKLIFATTRKRTSTSHKSPKKQQSTQSCGSASAVASPDFTNNAAVVEEQQRQQSPQQNRNNFPDNLVQQQQQTFPPTPTTTSNASLLQQQTLCPPTASETSYGTSFYIINAQTGSQSMGMVVPPNPSFNYCAPAPVSAVAPAEANYGLQQHNGTLSQFGWQQQSNYLLSLELDQQLQNCNLQQQQQWQQQQQEMEVAPPLPFNHLVNAATAQDFYSTMMENNQLISPNHTFQNGQPCQNNLPAAPDYSCESQLSDLDLYDEINELLRK